MLHRLIFSFALLPLLLGAAPDTRVPLPQELPGVFDSGCDATTGVWYPTLRPREFYAKSLSAYSADVREFLEESPELGERVCGWAACQRKTHALAPGAELRAALEKVCETRALTDPFVIPASLKEDRAAMSAEIDRGIADSKSWPAEKRRAAARDMMLRPRSGVTPLYVLGVRRDGIAVAQVLGRNERKRYVEGRAALREILESKVESDPDDADWLGALTEFHFYTGDILTARDLSRKLAAMPNARGYYAVLNAILERLAGDPAPLRRVISNCPPPSDDFIAFYGEPESRDEYCYYVIAGVAKRVENTFGDNAPIPLREMMVDLVTNRSVDSDRRIMTLSVLFNIDRPRSVEAARRLASDADEDQYVRSAAVEIANSNGRSEESLQGELQFSKSILAESTIYVPRRIRQADWDSIAAGRTLVLIAARNAQIALSGLFDYYMARHDDEATRATLEEMITAGTTNLNVADDLQLFARSLASRDKKAEASRIVGYLARLDESQHTRVAEYLHDELFGSREPLRIEKSPWEPLALEIEFKPDCQ